MKLRSLVVGCVAVLLWALAVSAQSARPQQQTPAQPQRTPAAAPAPVRAAANAQTPTIGADPVAGVLQAELRGLPQRGGREGRDGLGAQAADRHHRFRQRRQGPQDAGADRPQSASGADAPRHVAAAGSAGVRRAHDGARRCAGSHQRAVRAAAGAASTEPDGVCERRPRSARPEHRSWQVPAV